MWPKDQPLRCEVKRGRLIISIGVDTLAFADEARTHIKVTNPREFAKDVRDEILHEDEIGASILTNMLDKAMQEAVDQGSMYVEYPGGLDSDEDFA